LREGFQGLRPISIFFIVSPVIDLSESPDLKGRKVSYEMSELMRLMLSLPVAASWELTMQTSAARYRTVPRKPEIWNGDQHEVVDVRISSGGFFLSHLMWWKLADGNSSVYNRVGYH
jgi:hypothetical protein